MKKSIPIFDEKSLVLQCIKGNGMAQKQLYDQYARAMYHTIIRMVPFHADAEDILQEVFISVFENIDSYSMQSTLGAWIKKISINASLKHIRKRNAIQFVSEENVPEIMDGKTDEIQYDVESIHRQVKLLPEGCRVVLNLYLFEGYQHKEIASILNISESTSKSQYQRAKFLLKKGLKSMSDG